MLNSIYLYTKNISSLLFLRDRNIVLHDLHRQGKGFFNEQAPGISRELALENAMNWLMHAQHAMKDGGIGSFHIVDG